MTATGSDADRQQLTAAVAANSSLPHLRHRQQQQQQPRNTSNSVCAFVICSS